MAKKRKHRTAYQKATANIEAEGRKHCMILYSAAALALRRHWGKGRQAIISLFDITGEVWQDCAKTDERSMIEMCETETGIEVQNGSDKSWEHLSYLNGTLSQKRMTNAQWVYMRQKQAEWIPAQIMACIMIALHRKYGFGFDRLSRIYQQIDNIRAEFGLDGEKLRKAAYEEVHLDVTDIYLTPRR